MTINDKPSVETNFIVLSAAWTVAQAQLLLDHTPCAFVIVRRTDGAYYYWFSRAALREKLDSIPDHVPLMDALNLHEYTATRTIRREQVADTSGTAVVLDEDGAISGFVVPPGQAKNIPTESSPFTAYPAVVAPRYATLNVPFDLAVGFRNTPDPALIGGATPLVVADVQPTEDCMLVVTGDGVTFNRSTDWLPWRMNEMRLFSATPTRTGQCSIRVDYYRQRQLIGHAERRVAVDTNDLPEATPGAPLDFRPKDMDLLITLRRDGDLLRWTAVPHDGVQSQYV